MAIRVILLGGRRFARPVIFDVGLNFVPISLL